MTARPQSTLRWALGPRLEPRPMVTCPQCKGEGVWLSWPLDDVNEQCNLCDGSGEVSPEAAWDYHRERRHDGY